MLPCCFSNRRNDTQSEQGDWCSALIVQMLEFPRPRGLFPVLTDKVNSLYSSQLVVGALSKVFVRWYFICSNDSPRVRRWLVVVVGSCSPSSWLDCTLSTLVIIPIRSFSMELTGSLSINCLPSVSLSALIGAPFIPDLVPSIPLPSLHFRRYSSKVLVCDFLDSKRKTRRVNRA